jgi:predicted phage terminase large subunit-like protein
LTLEQVQAERCRRSFAFFCRKAWPLIDPAPLVWGWHLDAICLHLEVMFRAWLVARGRARVAIAKAIVAQLRKLIINIPPGHAKSMIVSVLFPAWAWALDPRWQVLTASHDMALALRDAVKSRELMDTNWYQDNFTWWRREPGGPLERWRFASDQNVKSYYKNTAQGHRLCLSVGSGTGWRGDWLLIDDPLKADDAYSDKLRAEVIRWKTETMSSRFNDLATACEVLIMQRLHEEDLSGYLLGRGGWDHLRLPTEFDPERRSRTSIGWEDPRTEEGELLFPEKFSRAVVDEIKSPGSGMGELAFAGQHNQHPSPVEGHMFRLGWWRFWRYPDEPSVPELEPRTVVVPRDVAWERVAISLDCTFKDTKASDFVCGGKWGQVGPNRFLLHLIWDRMGFGATCFALEDLIGKGPALSEIFIEDKANGSAVIETFRIKFPAVIPIEPAGGKQARAAATSSTVEAGNVLLPLHASWRERYMAEHAAFPNGKNDDSVDMQSQLLNRWRTGQVAWAIG